MTEILLLCAANLLLGLGLFVLALSVPFLYWRVFRGDSRLDAEAQRLHKRCDDLGARLDDGLRKVDLLDEAVGGLLDVAGVPRHLDNGQPLPARRVGP